MKNKIKILISVILLLFISMGTITFALKDKLMINDETFSLDNKRKNISSNFDNSFEIEYDDKNENHDLKQNITELTKKTTYLLLGEANSVNENSENYFKRHHDYLNLRYNPEIPKDEKFLTGLNQESQEYKDDILSGICLPRMFSILNELEVKYNNYGEIRVSIIDDMNVLSSITLTNVTIKEQDENNPMNYNIVKTDLTMYYYFKKLNEEYKLLYLYGETADDIKEYIENSNEKDGTLSKNVDYNSQLGDTYNFSKANAITNDTLTKIYNENKQKIVYLYSTYNTGSIVIANGFFINEGLILTTYNYIESSLIKAQNIIISDSSGVIYELDGIVTMNEKNDIAVLKVKNKNQNFIQVTDTNKIEKEDAIIILNSKTGIGLSTNKGIILSKDNDIQTSLPITEEMQGSPIFNNDGKLVGMINSKSFNTSISYATSLDIIKEYYEIAKAKNYEDIKAISFSELKENYYTKFTEEKTINDIPEDKWLEYNNVEDIKEKIALKLIKCSYGDGIISLRYKNDISNYIDTMQFANEYKQNLKNKGYKEKNISNSKAFYENDKYKIIIMKEFDYLIIVMEKL